MRLTSRLGRIAAALAVAAACHVAPLHAQTPPPAVAEITLRVIVTASAEDAAAVAARIGKGEAFADLAREKSVDPSARAGGLLGRVAPSALRPELQAALQGLAPGQVSRVVKVPAGFAIVLIEPEDASAIGAAGATGVGINTGLGAAGSVRYVLELSGFGEARTALKQFAKPPDWNHTPQAICQTRRASIDEMHRALTRHLASLGQSQAAASARDRMQTLMGSGLLYAYDGRMDETIRQLDEAYAIAKASSPDLVPFLEEALGVAHLHQATLENRVPQAPGLLSVMADRPSPAFPTIGHAEQAVQHFLEYLSARPDDLEVKWLLNLAYRATGGYPDKVPPAHLIPPSALASSEDVGRFVDVAPTVGLDQVAIAGGVIADDFDNDGILEVVMSSMDSCAPLRLFRRQGPGRFVEQAARAGVADQVGGLNLIQGDYDNDGCLDILVLRGGWDEAQRNSLLHANCNGTFTDVTFKSGLALPVTAGQTAVWVDFDNDGFLDLFVGNEDGPAQLFLNGQDGTFLDVAGPAGVARSAFIKGVTAGDYDNDGWPDLYVSNLSGDNILYRNTGGGTFLDVTHAAGVAAPTRSFATWFFDYDNDGWLDLFVTSYYLSLDETARTYLGLPHRADTLKLYRNRRDGTFADVTREAGLDKVLMPMGANFGDIDNDGWLDIYLGTGSPSYASVAPSMLLRNRDGRTFTDVTSSSGTGELGKGHGVAFADLDNDGDQDILFQVGGATLGDPHAFRVFDNPDHGNAWLEVRLVGRKSNRSAIGARIAVTVQQAGGTTRVLHRTVGSGGSFGASPLRQHFGLGKAEKVVSVDVTWPTSRTRQRFTDLAINQAIEITELGTSWTPMPRPRLATAGSSAP